jgi:broad specificity phosphatase PhoE
VCSNATVLTLVRHGRTGANAAGLLLGRLDPGLDEVGRWQVSRLADALGPVDRLVASPLTRTRETAAAIGRPVELDERVIELDYGVLDGLPLTDVPPEVWVRWRDDVDFAPDGGETLRTLSVRVSDALDELIDDARERHVVVVSHVLPIKAGVAWALGVGVEAAWRLHLDQASITRITVGPTGPVVRTYNDIAHLAGGRPPGPAA